MNRRIEVYCDRLPHEGHVTVEWLTEAWESGARLWTIEGPSGQNLMPDRGGGVRDISHYAPMRLEPRRWRIECPGCHYTAEATFHRSGLLVAGARLALTEALDKVAALGVSRLSIECLRGILNA